MEIVIASPFDIWAAGLECLLGERGFPVIGRSATLAEAVASARLRGANVLVASKLLLEAPDAGFSLSNTGQGFSGKTIAVVEPHEGVSPEAIATWRPDAVILSTSSSEDFVRCLLAVDEGRSWFDPGVRVQNGDEPAPNLASALSGRELEVARLASAGLSNKQIARILNISDGTIKIHMHHILGKLNLGSRSALAGLSPDLADTQTERGTDAIPVESDDSLPWRLKRARDCS